jgi:hypothetical protein
MRIGLPKILGRLLNIKSKIALGRAKYSRTIIRFPFFTALALNPMASTLK